METKISSVIKRKKKTPTEKPRKVVDVVEGLDYGRKRFAGVSGSDDTKQRKVIFLMQLEQSLGIVTPAIDATGISRQTFYNWKDSDSVFSRYVLEIDEQQMDFGETALKKLVAEGNPTAIIFYNKTKNAKRGYTEKMYIDHTTNGKDISPTLIINGKVEEA